MSLIVEEYYLVGSVLRCRDRLFAKLGSDFACQCTTDDILSDLVDGVCSMLPSAIPRSAVSQSLF